MQNGLKTTIESPEPARSDCHAWGAHPVYHFYASLLGIRPAEPGFRRVHIEPQMGHLTNVQATLVHPQGAISVQLSRQDDVLRGAITLPDALSGTLVLTSGTIPLHGGRQSVDAPLEVP